MAYIIDNMKTNEKQLEQIMIRQSKANAIEIFRFLFMVILCLWHFYPAHFPYLYHGYLVVEFFFILAGFLLYRSFIKNTDQTPLDYYLSRLRRFMPEYLFGIILCVIIKLFNNPEIQLHLYDITKSIMGIFCDILMLQSIGAFYDFASWNNPPMWYLSVLLYGGTLIYGFLYFNKKLTLSVVIPILCLWTYSYLLNNHGKLEVWMFENSLFTPFLRGLADISLGVICAAAFNNKYIITLRKYIRSAYVTFLALSIVTLTMFTWKSLDAYSLILFPILIISLMDHEHPLNKILSNCRWVSILGSLSWCMFVFHSIIVDFMNYFLPHCVNGILYRSLYLLSVIIFSLAWMTIKSKMSFLKN